MNVLSTNCLKAVAIMFNMKENGAIYDFEMCPCYNSYDSRRIEFKFKDECDDYGIIVDHLHYTIEHDYETVVRVDNVSDLVKAILLLKRIVDLGS